MPTIANMEKVNGIVISGTPAVPDAHTLIATATASSSATLSFTLGLDSLYDAYEFRFENMHPATDGASFQFQVNAAGQSGFNETMTTTVILAHHHESNDATTLAYSTYWDQAQGTAYQSIGSYETGNDNDQSSSGILKLYNPFSTTYVKHFTSDGSGAYKVEYLVSLKTAGYINTTGAIDEISFAMDSGNIDAGVIKMYGIAKA